MALSKGEFGVLLGVAGLGLAWYWNKNNATALAGIQNFLNRPVTNAATGGNVQTGNTPAFQTGDTLGDTWFSSLPQVVNPQVIPGVPIDPFTALPVTTDLQPIDAINRPGVYVDPVSGDFTIDPFAAAGYGASTNQ